MPTDATDVTVRPLSEQEWDAAVEVDAHAFGNTTPAEFLDAERGMHEPWRMLGVFRDDTLAGIAAAYSYELTIPGGVVPTAGVTWVGVLPTMRRRGVLRAMMTSQLTEVAAAGREPVAILWASEPVIYGRFGYGIASARYFVTVPRKPDVLRADTPRDSSVRLRIVDAQDWKLVASTYDDAVRQRPGMLARDARWHERAVRDFPSLRHDRSQLRCVVAEDGDGVRGYARYSTKAKWGAEGPAGVVDVREVVATDEAARAELYRYLFDLDLMATCELWNVPVDDPLLHWLTDPRGAQPTWADGLHVRLVDLPAALSARTYSTPVDVVVEVADELLPANARRWRIVGGPEAARCTQTDDAADLSLNVAALSAAYLGGVELTDLARAGRVVENRSGTLEAASAAFAHTPKPWCPAVF